MNSSLFGSRKYDPVYQNTCQHAYQYPRHQPTYQPVYHPTYQSVYQPAIQPAYQQSYIQNSYPYGNSDLSYRLTPESLYPYQIVAPRQHLQHYPYSNLYNYGSREPEVMIPAKRLETILIAILILVALDMLFVRSRH